MGTHRAAVWVMAAASVAAFASCSHQPPPQPLAPPGEPPQIGRYTMIPAPAGAIPGVWRLDSVTGNLRFCAVGQELVVSCAQAPI